MLINFWLANVQFIGEAVISIVCFAIAWLHLDATTVKFKREFFMRGVGFAIMSFYYIGSALDFANPTLVTVFKTCLIVGVLLVILSLVFQPSPAKPPKVGELILTAPLLLGVSIPDVAKILTLGASKLAIGALIAVLIVLFFNLSYRYFTNIEKFVAPLLISVALIIVSLVIVLTTGIERFSVAWIVEELLRMVGFSFLAAWMWQYLHFRVQEQMLLVFITLGLFISVLVSVSFSSQLINSIVANTKSAVNTDLGVLNYSFSNLKDQSVISAKIVASDPTIIASMRSNDNGALLRQTDHIFTNLRTNFLIVTDQTGKVIYRVHNRSAKGDNIADERVVKAAIEKRQSLSGVGEGVNEKFGIRAAAPIEDGGNLIGVVVAGYFTDNSFVDRLKQITTLEASVYKNDQLHATTIKDADNSRRLSSIVITDKEVKKTVFDNGRDFVAPTRIVNQSYIAGYSPIYDGGKVVGLLSVAKSQAELLATFREANRITFIFASVLVIILVIPLYWLAKSLSRQL